MNSKFIGQRVHNVYHHLADQSLPPDLWNRPAEIAAMVYLLKQYSKQVAADVYARTVQAYLKSNERVGIPMPSFDAAGAARRLEAVSRVVDTFPCDAPPGTIYRAMMGSEL